MRIGVFDSGHGGLEVLSHALRRIEAEYFYIADTFYHPYGNLDVRELEKRCHDLVKELVENKECEIILVACNTATAYAIESMRKSFSVPFVGVEPYLNYINVLKKSFSNEEDFKMGKISALVTPNTLRSDRFIELKKRLDPQGDIEAVAIADLAPAIEAFMLDKDLKSFQDKLTGILAGLENRHWDRTILGCTHYPLVAHHLEVALKTVCVSPSSAVVEQLVRRIEGLGQEIKIPSSDSQSFQLCQTRKEAHFDWQTFTMSHFIPLPF